MFLTSIATQPRKPLPSFRLILEPLEDRTVLSADAVLDWHQITLDAMVNDSYLGVNAKQAGPDRSSRALAIVHAAMFDAVNSIDQSYDPYLIRVKTTPGASIQAAAAQAAHDTLMALYPDYQSVLDSELATDLAEVGSDAARLAGVQVGQMVATAILSARANDGSTAPMHYELSTKLGSWQPDPLHPNQMPVGPEWGKVHTFTLKNKNQFQIPKPPALNSQAYADAYNEVKAYGGDGVTTPTIRTPEQTTIGIFWGYDGSRGLSTPPRLYNQIATTIAEQQGNTMVQNARFFALINLAMADAGISCWDDKYQFEFWRPVTGIRAGSLDGNANTEGDSNWLPLGAPNDNGGGTNFTPPFPAYASGHATFGASLFRTMARFYGTDNISFTIGSDEYNGITTDQHGEVRPVVFRSFDSFSQAAEENGQSRIYLGIHWKFDKEQGIRQGNSIADYVFQNYLRPRSNSPGMTLDQFRCVQLSNQDVVLQTTNSTPFRLVLGSGVRPITTIATNATSTQSFSNMVESLINRLDRGLWGGAKRGGKLLAVDLLAAKGPLFSVGMKL